MPGADPEPLLPPETETGEESAPLSTPAVGPDEDELPIMTDGAETELPEPGGIDVTLDGVSSFLRLTLPEGLTLARTAAQVEEQLGVSAEGFKKQATASNYVGDYPFLSDVSTKYDTLEGFLYATTYDLGEKGELTSDVVIRALLDEYADKDYIIKADTLEDLGAALADLMPATFSAEGEPPAEG